MKVTTTFWSEKVYEFTQLFFINSINEEIIFKADLQNTFATHAFFKQISKFIVSKKATRGDEKCFQFAVMLDGKIHPLKWFDFHPNPNTVISHDIAFGTTFIERNGLELPFGKFAFWYKKKSFPLYREFKIKRNAYKYIANQIKLVK